jgi:hypothetical protein
LAHAAALIGPGSDVLGFDTAMSTDHDWGPRILLIVPEKDAAVAEQVRAALDRRLPDEFLGYATRAADGVPRVPVQTLHRFVEQRLAFDLDRPIEPADWLTFPSQALLEITAGAVFHDGVGELIDLRKRLAYYPRDVCLYLLATGWQRIGQEEHLMPRAGFVGDELGSGVIGARLVWDAMSLGFLMERCYAPYPKWFGTAFGQLRCAPAPTPVLLAAQRAETWHAREEALVAASAHLARMHNALGLTEPLSEEPRGFHGRPFRVIGGERFAEALRSRIADPEVRRIAAGRLIGGIDQLSDSTDLRGGPEWQPILRQLYDLHPMSRGER